MNTQNTFSPLLLSAPSQGEENKPVFLMTKPDLMLNLLSFAGSRCGSDSGKEAGGGKGGETERRGEGDRRRGRRGREGSALSAEQRVLRGSAQRA